MFTLSESCKLTKVSDPTADGTSAVTSAAIDMAGYESALFFTSFGTAAAGNTLKAQQSDDDDDTDAYSDLEDSETAPGASDEDQFLDIVKPQKRYLKVVASRGSSSTLGDIWCLQYGARNRPVTNVVSGTITGKILVSPDEGTA